MFYSSLQGYRATIFPHVFLNRIWAIYLIHLYLAFTSKCYDCLSIYTYIYTLWIYYTMLKIICFIIYKFMYTNILWIDNDKIHSFMLDTNWIVCIHIVSKSYINKITCVLSINFNTLYRIHSASYFFYALKVSLPQSAK